MEAMLPRYTRPEMDRVWAPDQKFRFWLMVELAVLKVKCRLGLITDEQYCLIETSADFKVGRINELDEKFQHDLVAFVETVKETMRKRGVPEETVGLFHTDVTSYDIEDNAFPLQLRAAFKPILEMLRATREVIYKRALEHKWTAMVGQTHGQAAEIITLGIKLLNYVDLLDQHIKRLGSVMETQLVGRLGGAVGTYGHLGPKVEQLVCETLGLEPGRISTQITNRSRFADLFNTLVLLASDIEHIAEGMWQMCAFPRLEARVPFGKKQRGSSQMPHKRNPNKLEQLRGLAKVMDGYQVMITASIPTRDERAIDQSCVERIAWPGGTTLMHYALYRLKGEMEGIEFFPKQMQANIERTRGVLSSGFIKDLLLKHGITKLLYDGEELETYPFVQSCCFEAWEREVHLLVVLRERGISDQVPPDELVACFDNRRFLSHIDEIFDRFGPLSETAG